MTFIGGGCIRWTPPGGQPQRIGGTTWDGRTFVPGDEGGRRPGDEQEEDKGECGDIRGLRRRKGRKKRKRKRKRLRDRLRLYLQRTLSLLSYSYQASSDPYGFYYEIC